MTTVHVTNGDCAAGRLRAAGLDGRVIVSADVLHEGPLVEDGTEEEFRRRRAAFLAETGYATEHAALETLSRWDADVDAAQAADEVALWFEPDLFDQLQLVRLLARAASGRWGPRRLSVVCRETHPRLGDVSALGTLSAAAVQTLYSEREAVPPAALDAAAMAWRALCEPRPDGLVALLSKDTSSLPFLRAALERLLAEYPGSRDGTSLTDHFILHALDTSPIDSVRLFRTVQRLERRAFMGDSSLFARLRSLAKARNPLIAGAGGATLEQWRHLAVSITPVGVAVLRGEADAVAVNGVDRWIGGVHLEGDTVEWRWDRALALLIEQP